MRGKKYLFSWTEGYPSEGKTLLSIIFMDFDSKQDEQGPCSEREKDLAKSPS